MPNRPNRRNRPQPGEQTSPRGNYNKAPASKQQVAIPPSNGPSGEGGMIGGALRTPLGGLASARANPEYDPSAPVEERALPYKQAGFFRRLLGDNANQMNAAWQENVNALQFKAREAELAAQFEKEKGLEIERLRGTNDLAVQNERLRAIQEEARLKQIQAQGDFNLGVQKTEEETRIKNAGDLQLARDRLPVDAEAKLSEAMAKDGWDPLNPDHRAQYLVEGYFKRDTEQAKNAAAVREAASKATMSEAGAKSGMGTVGSFVYNPNKRTMLVPQPTQMFPSDINYNALGGKAADLMTPAYSKPASILEVPIDGTNNMPAPVLNPTVTPQPTGGLSPTKSSANKLTPEQLEYLRTGVKKN